MKHNSEEVVNVKTMFNANVKKPKKVTFEVDNSDELGSMLSA